MMTNSISFNPVAGSIVVTGKYNGNYTSLNPDECLIAKVMAFANSSYVE